LPSRSVLVAVVGFPDAVVLGFAFFGPRNHNQSSSSFAIVTSIGGFRDARQSRAPRPGSRISEPVSPGAQELSPDQDRSVSDFLAPGRDFPEAVRGGLNAGRIVTAVEVTVTSDKWLFAWTNEAEDLLVAPAARYPSFGDLGEQAMLDGVSLRICLGRAAGVEQLSL
jgi:hypothetical protein